MLKAQAESASNIGIICKSTRTPEEIRDLFGPVAIAAEGNSFYAVLGYGKNYDADNNRFMKTALLTPSADGVEVSENPEPLRIDGLRMLSGGKGFNPAVPHVNALAVRNFALDKAETYLNLPELQAMTHLLSEGASASDLDEAIAATPGPKVVIKPTKGEASNGVWIVDKSALKPEELAAYLAEQKSDLMVQEFVETSAGIPGFEALTAGKRHTLRILYQSGRPLLHIIRTADTGDMTMVNDTFNYEPVDTIPAGAIEAADQVDAKLKTLLIARDDAPEYEVAIDLMYDAGREKWYLGELNSAPLINRSREDVMKIWAPATAGLLGRLAAHGKPREGRSA